MELYVLKIRSTSAKNFQYLISAAVVEAKKNEYSHINIWWNLDPEYATSNGLTIKYPHFCYYCFDIVLYDIHQK